MASLTMGRNDIWALVLASERSKQRETVIQANVVIVGAKSSGKSRLAARFLRTSEEAKPTLGVDYRFGRRERSDDISNRDVAHVWEFGGGERFAGLLPQYITPASLTEAVVVIVADLSQPASVYQTVAFWLRAVRNQVQTALATFPPDERPLRRGPDLSSHPDAAQLEPVGIPAVIVCTHWDSFVNQDAECRKLLGRAVRFLAHRSGAHLMYTSATDEALGTRFRSAMNHLVYRTPPTRGCVTDHAKPLYVPPGMDSFDKIGTPPDIASGAARASSAASNDVARWNLVMQTTFGSAAASKESSLAFDPANEFAETKVDQARRDKRIELERYIKESDRRARQLAAATGQTASPTARKAGATTTAS